MSYFDEYKNRVKANSRVENRNVIQTKIKDSFYNSPSYYNVLFTLPSTPLASTPVDVHIVDDSKVKDLKVVSAYPGSLIEKGYLIYWQSKYWLTVSADPNFGEVYSRGRIIQCLSSLKWLDTDDEIREAYFAYISDRITENGIVNNNVLDIPNEKRYIIAQSNVYTQKLHKSMRFIIDERAWKVEGIDRLNEGLITLVLKEDLINPAVDNVDLRICNYYPASISSIPTTPTLPDGKKWLY